MMRSWSRRFLVVLAAASATQAWGDPAPQPPQAERSCSCEVREGAVKLMLATPDVLDRSREMHGPSELSPAASRQRTEAADQREREFMNEIWTLP